MGHVALDALVDNFAIERVQIQPNIVAKQAHVLLIQSAQKSVHERGRAKSRRVEVWYIVEFESRYQVLAFEDVNVSL